MSDENLGKVVKEWRIKVLLNCKQGLHFTESSIISFPSAQHDCNTVKKAIKLQVLHLSMWARLFKTNNIVS